MDKSYDLIKLARKANAREYAKVIKGLEKTIISYYSVDHNSEEHY